MGKIAEIKNCNQDRTFDLIREPDALYLSVKCSDNKGHIKIQKWSIVNKKDTILQAKTFA